MNKTLRFLALGLGLATLAQAATPIGIQLWSLRKVYEKDLTAGLDATQNFGFTTIETHSTYGKSAAEFRALLDSRHFTAVSGHFPYERLHGDLAGVIADAKSLGLHYVGLAWIPHKDFTADDAHRVAAEFNTWGAELSKAGLKFAFHPHGYEMKPDANGVTPFDIIAKETDPKLVFFEMDIFWIFHSGHSPAALLEKYAGRWKMIHVKDIRKGAVTGLYTGGAAPTDNVAVGDGQIDWNGVYAAAKKQGAEYFFIEDETTDALRNIPVSLKFLKEKDL